MQNNWKSIIVWGSLAIIVVVVVIVASVAFKNHGAKNSSQTSSAMQPVASADQTSSAKTQISPARLPNQTMAPSGQLIPGFPNSLVLNLSGKVSSSYSLITGTAKQYTVQFSTAKTAAEEFQAYADYFNSRGYKILSQNKLAGDTVDALYAEKKNSDGSTADVNFTASAPTGKDTQTQVTVSYLTK